MADADMLPSDVESVPPSLPSDPESCPGLPSDAEAASEPLCCQKGCLVTLEESAELKRFAEELSRCLGNLTSEEKRFLQFQCLLQWQVTPMGWRRWKVFGVAYFCKEAVAKVLKLSRRGLSDFLKQIGEGKLRPDQKLQKTQSQRESYAMVHANTMLAWVHQNIAETFAEGTRWLNDASSSKQLSCSARGLPKLQDVISGQVAMEEDECKWLPPHTTLAELREMAQSFLGTACSYSVFVSCYHQKWWRKLKVRAEGHHSKCETCEKLKQWRRSVISSSDVARIKEEMKMHREGFMRDREVDALLVANSKIACGITPGLPEMDLLSICIDAMDAAKFRCPRNVSATKEFASLWRPELHLLGAINPLTEHYFICDTDLRKDANLQITVLSAVLESAFHRLQQAGREMPTQLRVHTDNATAEGKNQSMFYYAAWLVHKGLFKQVSLTQFRVGHSHGLNDQRFAECREVLSSSPVLEDPSAFVDVLQQGVKPRDRRELDVQLLHATADWKSFFETIDLQTSGHTQTHGKSAAHKEAVHVFTFASRAETQRGSDGIQIAESYLLPPHDKDIILKCQLYLGSEDLSQTPFVFAAHEHFNRLQASRPQSLAPRTELTQRQHKEFQKTAERLAAPPWNMSLACAYLLKLLEDNADNGSLDWKPPRMDWVFLNARPAKDAVLPALPTMCEDDLQFARTKPHPVTVRDKAQKRQRLTRAADQLRQHLPPRAPPQTGGVAHEDISQPEPSLPSEAEVEAEPFQTAPLAPANTASSVAGAPAMMYGRHGAPANTVYEPAPHAPRRGRPKASAAPTPHAKRRAGAVQAKAKAKSKAKAKATPKIQAKAKSKAQAKTKAKARAKANAATGSQRGRAALPQPDNVELGPCSKCRNAGCSVCRKRAGLVLSEDGTAWIWPPDNN